MTDPTPATVAVPVELLERLLSEGFTITNVDEVRALLPKPTPRLVAVDLDDLENMTDYDIRVFLSSSRPLIDTLTGVLDEGVQNEVINLSQAKRIKGAFRKALEDLE